MSNDNPYEHVDSAVGFSKTPGLEPGDYPAVVVKACRNQKSTKNPGNAYMWADLIAIEPGREIEPGVKPSPTGVVRSWGEQIQGAKFPGYGLSAVRKFTAECLGIPDENMADKCLSITDSRQTASGRVYRMVVTTTKLKTDGTRFTAISVFPIEDQARYADQVKALMSTKDPIAAPAQAPKAPPLPAAGVFPPPGWYAHPQDPKLFYNAANEILNEAQLRARM